MAYQIISDGSCDLDPSLAEAKNIKVVPFYVSFDEKKYEKEIEEVDIRSFYQKMMDNPKLFPKSSLPSVQDYADVFKPYLEEKVDIICICITTKFSGSFNSARVAAEMMLEQYPDAKITVIDSTVNTVLQGIYVLEAARMRDAGLSYDETIQKLEEIKSTGRIIFTIGCMDYLVHGGRVGKVLGVAASTLKIKPLIILKEGEIFTAGISRTRSNSLKKIIELTKNHFIKNNLKADDYQFVIGYGYSKEEAETFKVQLLESMKTYAQPMDIELYQIGAAIGVHTGPEPLGVGLLRKYDA